MKAIPVTIETTNNYKVSMGEAVTTRPANLEELEVTENGTYTAPEEGGYTPVIVNVQPDLQFKIATPTETSQTVTPDSSYYGLSSVEVGAIPDDYIIPSGSKTITSNGTHDVAEYAEAVVDIPFVTYYTGSGAPSSLLGSNGDIYLRTS